MDIEDVIQKLIKKHYPERYWEKTENGWHSRALMPQDYAARREWVIKHYLEELEVLDG